jgi:hypothetical protein
MPAARRVRDLRSRGQHELLHASVDRPARRRATAAGSRRSRLPAGTAAVEALARQARVAGAAQLRARCRRALLGTVARCAAILADPAPKSRPPEPAATPCATSTLAPWRRRRGRGHRARRESAARPVRRRPCARLARRPGRLRQLIRAPARDRCRGFAKHGLRPAGAAPLVTGSRRGSVARLGTAAALSKRSSASAWSR